MIVIVFQKHPLSSTRRRLLVCEVLPRSGELGENGRRAILTTISVIFLDRSERRSVHFDAAFGELSSH